MTGTLMARLEEQRKIESKKLKNSNSKVCRIWFLGNGKGAFGGDDCWPFYLCV